MKGMPFILYMEPTLFCNLKCPSCPTGRGLLDYPKMKISLEDFKNNIDGISRNTFIIFMYNWGEPLLNKDFADMVQYASEKGIQIRASSNLSIPLTEEQVEKIVKSGLFHLKVGIDGATPEVHAMYRRGSDLNTVHNNVKLIQKTKEKLGMTTPKISVAYHVFAHNEHEIEKFFEQMKNLGVDSYGACGGWLPENGSVLAPSNNKYNIYGGANNQISTFISKKMNLPSCVWLYFAAVINPCKTIAPCCGVQSVRLDFGKMLDTNGKKDIFHQFQEVWNGEKYQTARNLFKSRKLREEWINTNLKDLNPERMTFSQPKNENEIICEKCPIPHTIDQWDSILETIFHSLREDLIYNLKKGKILNCVENCLKIMIVEISLIINKK